jgi:Family of unknown function (DUF5681)
MPRNATSGSFKPGQSGNPGGRPKSAHDFHAICRSHEPECIATLVRALSSGSRDAIRAAEILLAYSRGRPVHTMNVRKITSIGDLTDEELAAIVDEAAATISGTRH